MSVPTGSDRYLLLAIVHDWEDADAIRILRRVREALPAHGAAIVVENVLPDRPRDEFVVASDLLMLVLGPGRERTREQFGALFAESWPRARAPHGAADGVQRVRARPPDLTAQPSASAAAARRWSASSAGGTRALRPLVLGIT